MERGDLAAVIIGLSLVIVLMVVLSPPHAPGTEPTTRVPTPVPATTVPGSLPNPTSGTPPPTPETPTPTPFPAKRILYTADYARFPVRFLPADMALYGFSDIEWPYGSSFVFAYVEENHGGITEPFTVTYPVWKLVTSVSAVKTPEKARFRMILVDRQSGRIIEGVEIRFPGSVTKTVASRGRPLYMVIAAEGVDRFTVSLEAPSEFME
ncbi:MAG TPA: hypothetical protein VKO45_04000 [Methanomicrobiales archaeon]|nr:hypothetical protein [Methanomicrobiales archaeon]